MKFVVKIFWFAVYVCLLYSSQLLGTLAKRQVLLLNSLGQIRSEHALVTEFFTKNNVTEILYIPYARVNASYYNMYTEMTQHALFGENFTILGIHTFSDPVEAVKSAKGIYCSGGNSFVLLKRLYESNLINTIRKRVLEDGMPYMGSSAGSNVATHSIQTTNDMPIVYPPSFDGMNLVPFNINPHYVDVTPGPRGFEGRDDRIREFTVLNDTPVLALREGTLVMIDDDKATLHGHANALLFTRDAEPQDYEPESDLSFLLEPPIKPLEVESEVE
ncbi:probable alpha-aspartyl dipeptidase [Bradysia coprophila]|uniref:probable alpha-aspartyl dipeptidase n=1 Tax=Bradysia coprophila TaxID=38358 RepID=UPI00187DD868|nr:probable alpha-aspartyl dipeptidase [Bradysia coprophila]